MNMSYLAELPKSTYQGIVRMDVRGQSKSSADGLKGLVSTIKIPYVRTAKNYTI